jgi:hypothetical protein
MEGLCPTCMVNSEAHSRCEIVHSKDEFESNMYNAQQVAEYDGELDRE